MGGQKLLKKLLILYGDILYINKYGTLLSGKNQRERERIFKEIVKCGGFGKCAENNLVMRK